MHSKWYRPLVVPKFTRRGKHFNFQPSPPGTCTTLDGAAQRHHFIVRPALPTGADLQGSPPSLRPSRTSFLVLIPLVPPWFNGSPGVSRGALPLTVVKTQSTPLTSHVLRWEHQGFKAPATAMANYCKGIRPVLKWWGPAPVSRRALWVED